MDCLRELAPYASILALSRNPAYTTRYHGIDADDYIENLLGPQTLSERIFFKISAKLGFIYKIARLAMNALLLRFIRRTVFLTYKERRYLRNLSRADLIFTDGGGTISDRTNMFKTLTSQLITYLLASILGKPIFLSGQTIGPFEKRSFAMLLTRICLNRVNVITLRDHHFSPKTLEKLRITKPSVYLSTDDAFSLPASSDERIEQLFKEQSIVIPKGKALIGVNMANYGEARDEKFKKMFAEFLDFLITERSAHIVFIPTDYHRPGSDVEIMSEIAGFVKHKHGVHVLPEKYKAKELKGIISKMDFGIGARYHFNVFSATTGVSSIAIAINDFADIRHNGVMNMLEIKNNVVRLQDLTVETLIAKFDELYKDREQFKERIKEPIAKYENHTINYLKMAVELMGEDSGLQLTEEEIEKDIAALDSEKREAMIMDYAHELEKASLNFDTVYTPGVGKRFEYLKVLLREWKKDQKIEKPNIIWAEKMLNDFSMVEKSESRCEACKTPFSVEELLDVIKTRRSTRCWSEKEIPEEILKKLIIAGTWAPSYGNRQTCRYYLVRNEIKKEKLALMRERFFFKAKVLVLIGVDTRLYNAFEITHAPFLDVGLAMQNILLAAHAAGLGACPAQLTTQELEASNFKSDHFKNVRSCLNIPEHVIPVGIIGLGYPKKVPCAPPRKSLDEIAFFH